MMDLGKIAKYHLAINIPDGVTSRQPTYTHTARE